ncbi:MAG: porin family protein [Bacteroidota bacterium]
MKQLSLAFTFLAFFFVSHALQAQQGWKVGGFAQPQFVFLYNADDIELEPEAYTPEALWGMAGGVVLGYNFNDYFGFRVNGIFSQQGGKYSVIDGINSETNFTTRLEYFKVPLMIGFNTNPINRKVLFSIYAGMQAGFLTSAFLYNDNPAYDLLLSEEISRFPTGTELYNSIDYSVVGEVGFDVQLPPDNFTLNLRLRGDYSIQDVENKEATFRITEGGNTRNERYWPFFRGLTRNADTFGLTAGLLVGVTYTFPTY